jgi:hypothetical protein
MDATWFFILFLLVVSWFFAYLTIEIRLMMLHAREPPSTLTEQELQRRVTGLEGNLRRLEEHFVALVYEIDGIKRATTRNVRWA